MNQEKMTDLLSNQDFLNSLSHLNTAEEVQEAFKKKGVEVSIEELNSIRNMIMDNKNLSVDQLDEVAGGLSIAGTITDLKNAISLIDSTVRGWISGR